MKNQDVILSLSSVDEFYRNALFLLRQDMEKAIQSKLINENLINLLNPESGYWINSTTSESSGLYVFKVFNKIRFFFILIKSHEDHLKLSNSTGFKSLCGQLNIDPLFPLLFIIGTFNVGESGFTNYHHMRSWAKHSLLINVNDKSNLNLNGLNDLEQLASTVAFGRDFIVTGNPSNSWWNVTSTVRIYDLLSIKSSTDVGEKVDELLKM